MSVPFLSVKPRAIKLKVQPRFPAQLIGRAGIDVTKTNGNYYLDLDFTDFPVIGSVPPGATYALIFNPATGQYAQIPISLLGGSGPAPATTVPLIESGAGAVGVSLNYARADHVHPAFGGGGAGREKLTGARTYFVSATGSDSNDGLTAGTPFLTIQKAYDTITNTLDLGGQTVTIQTTNATFAPLNMASAWTGGGNVLLDLASGTISVPAGGIGVNCSVPLPGIFTLRNLTMVMTANTGSLISHGGTGTMQVGDIILNGGVSTGYDLVAAYANANLRFVGNITLGAASGWREIFYVHVSALIDLYGSFGQTMTMTGNMSWSDSFVYVDPGGVMQAVAAARTINLGGFTMTGKKFTVAPGAVLNSNGGGLNYLPGSIAGTPAVVSTAGAYA
jgi:hypothetical protein